MQTVTLKINDGFYSHFMALVDSLPKKQIKVVKKAYPSAIVESDINSVKNRIAKAELSPSVSENEYKQEMDLFFKNQINIK